MARYNPKNKGHRKSLAKRIEKMLSASGFSVDPDAKGEVVYIRPVAGTTARVRVLTSIVNGEMRQKDEDAIRVCAVLDINGGSRGLVKSTRVNRVGEVEGITARLLAAMRSTYATARKRANDPGFLALPVKPSKKRWVPRKKAASKRTTAKNLNAALKAKADADSPLPRPAFTVGQLVTKTGRSGSPTVKGIIRAVNITPGPSQGRISVFWFHDASTRVERHVDLKILVA